ncbi:SCO family protein [Azohydromonas australica]|uniref:SCO family protein n=1 Tax=Azohydromonas australica TaxID=364039 RepID=UPI0003F9B11F|nr:hypothetical protein [Azohydromonas australica]
MSGSNSSAPAGAPPEPLSLTVHSMPRPELDAQARRTRSGRLKMLLVLLACASPVVASYFTYFVVRPEGRSNYAALIDPPHELPPLALRTLEGQQVPAASFKGQWLLVVTGSGDCDADCEKLLYLQRQLREMTGRERERIDKLWLVTDDQMPPAALQKAVLDAGAAQILRADPAQVAQWLQPAPGESLSSHLYVVDPMGQWMMRAPVRPDPSRLKRDLERLLRASASWDREGR